MTVRYEASDLFWDVLNRIQTGVSTTQQANDLLNETYGKPAGAEVALIYQPETIDPDDFIIREARIMQVGYAVSSNPVLPRLTGFEGQELTATVGWKFVEAYGGRVFGKSTNAVSTDLIDRRLVQEDNVNLFGFGIRYHYDFPKSRSLSFPLTFDAFTRDTFFFPEIGDATFLNRWRLRMDAIPDGYDFFLILGQNPTPDFDVNGLIWDYIWNIELFPDPLSLVGLGMKFPKINFLNTVIQAGFFGGYVGGEVTFEPLEACRISIHSYGFETTSAFQAQQLRLTGASVSFIF